MVRQWDDTEWAIRRRRWHAGPSLTQQPKRVAIVVSMVRVLQCCNGGLYVCFNVDSGHHFAKLFQSLLTFLKVRHGTWQFFVRFQTSNSTRLIANRYELTTAEPDIFI